MNMTAKAVIRNTLRGLIRMLGPKRITRLAIAEVIDDVGEIASADDPALDALIAQAWHHGFVSRFLSEHVGQEYNVSRKQKLALLKQFQNNTRAIPSGTGWVYHMVLAQAILSLPRTLPGEVIECGCWKGASTASLSLVCSLVGRKLLVCDSFEGLPEEGADEVHVYPHINVYGYYQKGMYAARLEEVRANVGAHGDLSVCRFVPGYFHDSLKSLTAPLVFAFLDVDLVSSMRDCLRSIWPLLVEGGLVYTDDSGDMEVVRVWFDDEFWQKELGQRSPGYVGSGCGLPVTPSFSTLGYIGKHSDPTTSFKRSQWLYYPDAQPSGRQFSVSEAS